jgi:hypothetical protein
MMQRIFQPTQAMRAICGGLMVMFLMIGGATPLLSQTDTARIQGLVTDLSDAVVPNAAITVTNTATNAVAKATSDGSGSFSVNALPVGTYSVVTTAAGFGIVTQHLTLTVSQVQELNVKLTSGTVSQTVEVTESLPLVQTSSSETGTVINDRQLSDLPLNGRNFTQLALLAPGITRGAYNNSASGVNGAVETLRYNDTGAGSLAANGLRPQANNFILDGLDNNESLVNTINFFPPVEAMSEFRVTNSLAPAEFGRAGGAIVQAAIKSGTNSIHGSAFVFYRDFGLGGASENYFAPTTKEVNSHRNQFGATIGGPLLKDKLFLFFDYQGLRENIPQGLTISTTPTSLMRQGNFSELLGSGITTVPTTFGGTSYSPTGCPSFQTVHGITVTTQAQLNASVDNGAIFDPLTCNQFGTASAPNIIPSGRLNAAAVKYLSAFPAANRTPISQVLNNYQNQQIISNRYNDFDVRMDFRLGQKDSFFARYSYAQDNNNKTTRYVGLPSGFGSGSNNTHPRGLAAGETHVFSSNIVNEARFGYTRPFYGYINPFEGTALSQSFGILNANRTPLLGGGALIGGYDGEIGYTGDGGPYEVPQHSYQYLDSLSYTHGHHTFKVGGNIIFRQVDFFQADYRAKGFFFIQGNGADYTGYEVSELLAAFVDNYSIANPLGFYKTRSTESGYFVQDDWKVNNRLTLNLGLRYDFYTYPYEEANRQSNFDLASGSLKVAAVGGSSRSLINTPKTNFAPRIGFAYDVHGNGKMAVRGGYGIYYFLDRGGVGNQLSNNPDFNGASNYSSNNGYRITFSGQTPTVTSTGVGPYPGNNNALATAALPPATVTVNEAAPTNVSVISYPVNNPIPRIQQYNLSVQQELDSNTTATITYVGTKADNLFTGINYTSNQIGTGAKFFSARGLSVTLNENAGTSYYNGLQTSMTHRLSKGLQFTAAYTWSHATDNSTGPFSPEGASSFPIDASGPRFDLNRGNTGDDQRHFFTFSALAELPFGKGKMFVPNANRALDYLIGGWQLSPFVTIGTGTPFDLSTNSQGGVNSRPDLVGNPQVGLKKNFTNNYFAYATSSAFKDPPVSGSVYSRVGNVHRNQYYGPGYNTTSLSVIKAIPIVERVKSEFRLQAYNLFNHPQFGNPSNTNIDQSPAIIINGTRFRSARELELAYRITF